jgi:hypothetical protein
MIRSSSHRSFDEGGLALATLNHKAALSVARDGARVRGQHAHRHPTESRGEAEAQHQTKHLSAESLTQERRVVYANGQRGSAPEPGGPNR